MEKVDTAYKFVISHEYIFSHELMVRELIVSLIHCSVVAIGFLCLSFFSTERTKII